jgi:hypothetical protein
MTQSVLTKKARRRRLWQPHPGVLLPSTRWFVLCITIHPSIIIISWLSVHRCIRTLCLEMWHPTDRVVPTIIENGHSLQHLLQLWSSWSHRSRLYCTKVEFCSSSVEPLQPAPLWSNKGRCYKSWSCELHNCR